MIETNRELMDKYCRELIQAFVDARGFESPALKPHEFHSEFDKWVQERKLLGMQYTYFLDSLGFNYQEADCAEVGKGKYDSVVKPFNTSIISPVPSSFNITYEPRLIAENMIVIGYTPVLIRPRNDLNITPDQITTFMTQNPYSLGNIRGWNDLHNSANGDIIVGIYGKIDDEDHRKKVKMFEEFMNQLDDDIVCDYASLGDSYFYTVGSKRKVLGRVKSR